MLRNGVGGAVRGRGRLPEFPLVLGQHDLASAIRPGEGEHAVGGVLGVLGLLRRGEGDEGPLPAWLACGLQEEVYDLPILGELRPQRLVRDAVGQRTHEDLPRALGRGQRRVVAAVPGGDHTRVLRLDGILAKHPLVSRHGHLAGPLGAREGEHLVAAVPRKLGLLRRRKGNECPLAARLASGLDEDVDDMPVPGELLPQHVVRDAVGQGAHKNLLRSHLRVRDAVLAVATCRCAPVGRRRPVGQVRGTGREGLLAEHALVPGESHLASPRGPG
mmetsp:Transcript_138035/g.429006  ORF Transcript_138035/g.429006 Transcript_138035/m.429006 type:complete len:274 (+) Transcript_138035:419-1240(+)